VGKYWKLGGHKPPRILRSHVVLNLEGGGRDETSLADVQLQYGGGKEWVVVIGAVGESRAIFGGGRRGEGKGRSTGFYSRKEE